eukprot:gene24360-biopygen993
MASDTVRILYGEDDGGGDVFGDGGYACRDGGRGDGASDDGGCGHGVFDAGAGGRGCCCGGDNGDGSAHYVARRPVRYVSKAFATESVRTLAGS